MKEKMKQSFAGRSRLGHQAAEGLICNVALERDGTSQKKIGRHGAGQKSPWARLGWIRDRAFCKFE